MTSLQQLIRTASIYRLERRLIAAGRRGATSGFRQTTGRPFEGPLEAWIVEAAEALAQAIATLLAVIDFEAIIIDGAFPATCAGRLVARTNEQWSRMDRQGLTEDRGGGRLDRTRCAGHRWRGPAATRRFRARSRRAVQGVSYGTDASTCPMRRANGPERHPVHR